LFDIAISPDYQRRGIGSKLVSYGVTKADEAGIPIFLTASPLGAKLYPKFGFLELERLEVNVEEFGGESDEVNVHRKSKFKA